MGSFKTEVLDRDPRRNSTDQMRDTALLAPDLRRKIEAVIADAAVGGHRLIVLETYRSQARQEQLFTQGKSRLRQAGCHGFGLACDLGFLNEQCEVNWSADYSVLGRIARAHNLVWGGDWGEPEKAHSFRDLDHVQLCSMADEERLFNGNWYPDEGYDPYKG